MFLKTTIKLSFIRGLSTVLHVLFGISLASFFGAYPEMDAYVTASNLVIYLNFLFMRAQTKTFIPFIAEYKNDSNLFKELTVSIMRFNIVIFTFVSIIIFIFSDWITVILAPGLSSDLRNIASNILKILSVFILFSNINAIVIGLMEYNLKFEKSAIILLIQSVLLIFILFICESFFGIYSIPIAHIVSLLIITIVFIHYYLKFGNGFKTTLKFYNNYLKKYLHLLVPIMLASFFTWFIRYADVFIASFLKSGSISYLSYCQRITTHLSGITTAICVIYFPLLSKLNEKKDNIEFVNTFYYGLQMQFSVALYVSIFIVTFRKAIVTLLFERGKFLHADTEIVSLLLVYYFLVLLCAPMGTYLANAYFCRQKPKMAKIFSIISSSVNIVLNFIFGFMFGIFGLAAASSVAFLTGNILQISNIRRINPEYRLRIALERMLNPFICGVLTFLIIYFVNSVFYKMIPENIFGLIGYVGIGFIIYTIIFLFLCFLFRVAFVIEGFEKVRKRLQKKL